LSRVLLNNEEDLDNAADRARLAFQVKRMKSSPQNIYFEPILQF
jgi:hypothetical protein